MQACVTPAREAPVTVDVEARLDALEERMTRLEAASRALESLPHSMGIVQGSLGRLLDAVTAQTLELQRITKLLELVTRRSDVGG